MSAAAAPARRRRKEKNSSPGLNPDECRRIKQALTAWTCSTAWTDDLYGAVRNGLVAFRVDRDGNLATSLAGLLAAVTRAGLYPPKATSKTSKMRACYGPSCARVALLGVAGPDVPPVEIPVTSPTLYPSRYVSGYRCDTCRANSAHISEEMREGDFHPGFWGTSRTGEEFAKWRRHLVHNKGWRKFPLRKIGITDPYVRKSLVAYRWGQVVGTAGEFSCDPVTVELKRRGLGNVGCLKDFLKLGHKFEEVSALTAEQAAEVTALVEAYQPTDTTSGVKYRHQRTRQAGSKLRAAIAAVKAAGQTLSPEVMRVLKVSA